MRNVLAAINSDACAEPVLGTAVALADVEGDRGCVEQFGERDRRA